MFNMLSRNGNSNLALSQFKREIELALEESKRLVGVQKGLRRGTVDFCHVCNIKYVIPIPIQDVKQAQESSIMQARALKGTQEE